MDRTRSRSRDSRPRQASNYSARSRSRSPFYMNNREKNHRFEGKPFNRGNYHHHNARRPFDHRRRDDFRHQRDLSPRRSLPYMSRNDSPNQLLASSHGSSGKRGFGDHHRHDRSPEPYGDVYRPSTRSPSPQRLTTEPIAKDTTIFRGPEGTLIDLNELKKITVDIRRNLPRSAISSSHGPLRYAFNPAEFVLVRRPGEGSRPIFDREELRPNQLVEERVIKLAHDMPERMDLEPSPRSRDAYAGSSGFQQQDQQQQQQDTRSMDGDSEGDLRFRLMEKKSSEETKERMNADPNFVPQGRYYYEHDNRDRYNNRGRGFVYRGNGRGNYHHHNQNQQQHNFRGGHNYRGGGGGGQFRDSYRGSFRGKLRSPDWQHDLYDAVAVADDGKPSSTTAM